MSIKSFILSCAAVLVGSTFAIADVTVGEYGWLENGEPAMAGTATTDHVFTRMTYDGVTHDNKVSLPDDSPQLVWFWLDDDAIYQNQAVQALTPIAYNNTGDLYNEITYNSLQLDLYLPDGIELVTTENDEGDVSSYEQGGRLPSVTSISWKKNIDKVIDGVTYHVYTVLCYSVTDYGTHFSGRNAKSYRDNGALRKDDAPLFGLYVKNSGQAESGYINDLIVANQMFYVREAGLAGWSINQRTYWYMTGGNEAEQRFQLYNRVALYAGDIEQGLRGDVNGDGFADPSDISALIDYLLNGSPVDEGNSDCDLNGCIDPGDISALIDYLLNGVWAN